MMKNNVDTEYPSAAMFGPDGIVVPSLAVTYLTLTNESKVNKGHCHWNPWDITSMHQMNRFGSDVVFGSDAAVLKTLLQLIWSWKVCQQSTRFTVLKTYMIFATFTKCSLW